MTTQEAAHTAQAERSCVPFTSRSAAVEPRTIRGVGTRTNAKW
jgi:hypothetical protein